MTDDARDGAVYDRREEARATPEEFVRSWLDAIKLAGGQEDEWRRDADEAAKLYRADKQAKTAFNILHSNVETIVPALYNSTPLPDVRSRYDDRDPVASDAATLIERALSYGLDDEDFDGTAERFVTDMEVVGRGVARVGYEPLQHVDQDGGAEVVFEEAPARHWPWRDFRRGPGAAWRDVTWIAYRHRMTAEEIEALIVEGAAASNTPIPPETVRSIVDQMTFDEAPTKGEADKGADEPRILKRTEVWEIWDRETRQIVFIASCYQDQPLAVLPDPLGLVGFFDTPRPLMAINDVDGQVPVVPYQVYRQQAEELNRVSSRILKLIDQLKFRGIYASEITEMGGLQDLVDGEFAPSRGAMAVLTQDSGGLGNAIWTVPVDILITVLQQLLVQREQIKQAIYEITGIADILRGATDPGETARAQSIKAQWGSLRIQRAQTAVQRYCRDLFRLKAEIISNKFSPETLAMINGEPVQQPVMEMLRSDYVRRCKVDVETDSTIQADLERSRANMTEFMAGTAKFMEIAIPAAQTLPMLSPALIEVFMAFAGKLKLGKKADRALAEVAQKIQQAAAEQEQKAQQEQGRQDEIKREAEELQRRGAMAEVAKIEGEAANEQADAQHTGAETQKTVVETQRLMVEPIVPPQQGGPVQ